MTGASPPADLTAEQWTVVGATAEARLVVIAPAGSGKTEVVRRRVQALIERDAVSPSEGILILSFYNAAVDEVKHRLRGAGPLVAAVESSTFDSYASRLLARFDGSDEWKNDGYLERIRRATALVRSDEDVRGAVAEYRHLIIDEVQDLVGDRAEFVDAILLAMAPTAGYTLLGDPAQGISDFQLEGSRAQTTGLQFLRRVRGRQPEPEIYEFTRNFRARSKLTARLASKGTVIRKRALQACDDDGDGGVVGEVIGLTTYNDGDTIDILEELGEDGATGAILCRYNSQALVASRMLDAAGLAHRLRGEAGDTWVGPWLATTFRGYEHPVVSREQFAGLISDVEFKHSDARAVWRALKRAEGQRGRDISLADLSSGLRTRRIPTEIEEVVPAAIDVSSVHRAKGRQWDVVFTCGLDTIGKDFDELRISYVALTRARDEVYAWVEPDTRAMRRRDQADGRWVRASTRTWVMTQIEILPVDVESEHPAGLEQLELPAAAIQEYLATQVGPGDQVTFTLVRSLPWPVYRVEHRDHPIGVTSRLLGEAVAENVARAGSDVFPRRMRGARVQAVETIGGSGAAGMRAGVGAAGLWLRPRLQGLADVDLGG